MKKSKNYKIIAFVVFISIVSLLVLVRSFFSAEISDESFYISEVLLIKHNVLPISDSWLQTMTFGFILYPFLFIYDLFFKNNEGIFLFFRLSTIILKFCIGLYLYSGLKQYIKKETAILPLFILLPLNYLGTIIPGYTTLGIYSFILFSFSLLFYKLSKKNKYIVLAGIFYVTLSLSYPPFLFLIIYFVFVLYRDFKEIILKIIRCFLFTIIGFSFLFILIYLINGKSIDDILNGLYIILTKIPYFKIQSSSKLNVFVDQLFQVWNVSYLIVVASIIIVIIFAIAFKTNFLRISRSRLTIFLNFVIVIYSIIFFSINHGNSITISMYYLSLLVIPIFLFIISSKNQLSKDLIKYVWVPNIIIEIIFVLFTGDGFIHRGISAYPSILIIPIMFNNIEIDEIEFILRTSYPSFSIVFVVLTLFTMFFTVYRDVDVFESNCIISKGVYKGIITNEKKCKGLVNLENIIRMNTNKQETVLFLDNVPMAYLMSNSSPLTPSTWEISAYSYGFNDDFLYKAYFDYQNKLPSKIIYIDTGRDKTVSIMDENYRFSIFVKLNYNLVQEYISEIYPVHVYQIKSNKSQ